MSNGSHKQDSTGITRQIAVLRPPLQATDQPELDDGYLKALLVCCDSESLKWGPRWLGRSGLTVVTSTDPGNALEHARAETPDVIVVEAGLQDQSGVALADVFRDAADVVVPVVAFCRTTKEYAAAVGAGVYDVIRKPLDWQLVGKRSRQAADSHAMGKRLATAQTALAESIDVAENARQLLRRRESFEPVTGLPNKTKFVDLLRRGMLAADRDQTTLAVFVTGFSRFRLVVEALGQDGADLALAQVGKLLSECLHDAGAAQANMPGLKTAAVAVIDASRFGLMLTCSPDGAELAALRKKLEETLAQPVAVSGQTIYLSACTGAALYPKDANDCDQLLQRADNAMLDARSRGGGFKFYCTETDAAAERKLQLEHRLHQAFDRGELTLAYQPLTETMSGRITGAEALLRWQQQDKSFISPDLFVPIAEESGLMIRIGEFVLDRACQQLREWQHAGLPISHMCVNVSKRQLMSGAFVGTVRKALDTHAIDPGALELELSERGVLSGDYNVISQLHELKELGVKLSVDDFGTGEAALGYLKELPIDVVKIDRTYVNGLTNNSKDAAITSAMIVLGQKLNLKVVAEGVESLAQLAVLRDLGCDEYQGFIVSPAVPSAEFPKLLEKGTQSES